MRLLVTTLVCTAFICSAFPQHISMEYSGAGLANRDKKHIELFLRHAAKFYHQHGMPDTLRIKLNLFDNKEKWDEFIFSKEKNSFGFLSFLAALAAWEVSGPGMELSHSSDNVRSLTW